MASKTLWTFHNRSDAGSERAAEERAAVDLCRKGEWKRGVEVLERLLAAAGPSGAPPLSPLGLSCLGLGWIRLRRPGREGLALCEQAARRDFYQPEVLFHLAAAYLELNQRQRAAAVLAKGLKIDSDHPQLRELEAQLGRRRDPVFASLSRRNPLNRVVGKVRHELGAKRRPRPDAKKKTGA